MATNSSILYKFRSGIHFENLPLPGTSATLFDVKKTIVKAKQLDKASLEFDLSVCNANNEDEVYSDDSMLLPRGSCVIVRRVPASKGMGLLNRIAKGELGISSGTPKRVSLRENAPVGSVDHSRFYEIASRDDEEFLLTKEEDDDKIIAKKHEDEDKNELEKLQNILDTHKHSSVTSINSSTVFSSYRPNLTGGGRHRYNADPEIRNEEKNQCLQQQNKKRTTGIPRPFLKLSMVNNKAGATNDNIKEGGQSELDVSNDTYKLQPNALGFQELLSHFGGKSTSSTHTSKNLDYALQLTNEKIPDFLKCGICHSLVKDAMLLPWDTEGRTACEKCIRTALNTSGFTCPLTNIDGVSPDDLHPNHGLRKAAENFLKGVWEKVESIEKEQQLEQKQLLQQGEELTESKQAPDYTDVVMQSNQREKEKKRKKDDDDFGGDDDEFGGDVFAVTADITQTSSDLGKDEVIDQKIVDTTKIASDGSAKNVDKTNANDATPTGVSTNSAIPQANVNVIQQQQTIANNQIHDNSKKKQSRGPPPGYSFGVAQNNNFSPPLIPIGVPPPPPPPPMVKANLPMDDNGNRQSNKRQKVDDANKQGKTMRMSSPPSFTRSNNKHYVTSHGRYHHQQYNYPSRQPSKRGPSRNYHPSHRGRGYTSPGGGFDQRGPPPGPGFHYGSRSGGSVHSPVPYHEWHGGTHNMRGRGPHCVPHVPFRGGYVM